jgi:hypothetical protein
MGDLGPSTDAAVPVGSEPRKSADPLPDRAGGTRVKAVDVEQCPRCRQIVPAISLTVVDGAWICRECRARREPPAPVPLDQPAQQDASLHGGWYGAARWTVGDGTVTVVIRALLYLAVFAGLDPKDSVTQFHVHAALSGVLAGDLLAWMVFAVVDFTHLEGGVPIQFLAFGAATTAIAQFTGQLPLPDDPYAVAFAFPFFLLTCAAKTAWWQVKRTLG